MRPVALPLFFLFLLAGCKKQVPCDSTDSQAVCKGFQDCMHSDTSPEVCRMAEQDANKVGKQPPTKH